MIFVILGTQKFQLNRLLKVLDEYVRDGKIQEGVFAQIGYSTYLPKHFEYRRFLDKADYDYKIQQANLVISHAGVGSILNVNKAGKPCIVFPRLAKYNEHVDDHQCEVAEEFSQKKYVLVCHEKDDLLEMIQKSRNMSFGHYDDQEENMLHIILDFLQSMEGE